MVKVGVTGGIGSGKSTVCRVFEVLGIPVFYADDEARKLMNTDDDLKRQLSDAFGDATYANGSLDRAYLAGKVFNQPDQLAILNSITHPAVFRAFDRWAEEHRSAPYVMKEAALLFESGSYRDCTKIVVVTAPVEMRIARVLQRDRLAEAEVRNRMARQWTDEQKLALCDIEIKNDERQLIVPQIVDLHRMFTLLPSSAK